MNTVPEAQLQSYVTGLAREAFPHEKPSDFKVEKRFKLKLGHTEQNHNGTANWEAEGRADLLLFHNERPLAVVELKRADKTLKQKDLEQGQSYAAMLFPRPPLVIVSNGSDTWVRQVDTGQEIPRDIVGGTVVEKIFANIGKLAAANNSWAIEVLMGPESTVWVEAVRQRTDDLVERLTGEPDDTQKPFGRGLLFHRKATDKIIQELVTGTKAVIVTGAPLAGKSNTLRDFSMITRDSPDWALFMVNGATGGAGLFQRLANILGATLEWKLTADDVRTWLRRMSHSGRGPALVLAVDGMKPNTPVAQEFEELAETGFGETLRLIGCCEIADDILLDSTCRNESAISSIAKVVEVEALDNDEFTLIEEQMNKRRICFYPGADLSNEYRTAWLLRTVLSHVAPPEQNDLVAVIPATMGVRFVQSARARFDALNDVARLHRLVARDVLHDEASPDPEVTLAGANAFIVRRDSLSSAGEAAAVELQKEGWVRFYRHACGEDLIAFRVPELFMSELALELADIIDTILHDEPDEAYRMLIWQAERFFLGDIVGAQALVDLGKKRNGLPHGLLVPMMNHPPNVESVAGKTIGLQMPNGSVANFRFNENGDIAQADAHGNVVGDYIPNSEDEEVGVMYGGTMPWMVLAQLASIRTALGSEIEDRFDIQIMLWVGRAQMALMRGESMDNIRAKCTLDLGKAGSILSAEHALAEPLTTAIHSLFIREWRDIDFFFESMVEADSLPLTVRVHHALNMLQGSSISGLEDWARDKITSIIHPLLREQFARETS